MKVLDVGSGLGGAATYIASVSDNGSGLVTVTDGCKLFIRATNFVTCIHNLVAYTSSE